MKKKLLACLCATMMIGSLVACGGDASESSSPIATLEPEPISTEASVEESEAVSEEATSEYTEITFEDGLKSGGEYHTIGEREEVNGQKQSYLTGEWKDADVVNRRAMAVMTPNNRRAGYKDSSPLLYQFGIGNASIIYEAPVEGRITRLMAYYEDYDDLDLIGPIRSSRDYYIYEAMSFDSIYVNWGLARPWVEELINSSKIDNISASVEGIYNGYDAAFTRNKSLISGAATEFTGFLDVAGYTKGVAARGYETTYRDTFEKTFEFADDGYIAAYEDKPDVVKIYPGGTSSNSGGYGNNQPCFSYDPETRLYYRTQWGSAHVDGYTKEQLAVTNVILKVCDGYERVPDDPAYDYLGFETMGKGGAYIFTNGKLITAEWRRESETSPTRYFGADGNEVVLNQGKTWICCIWDEYHDCISWE